MFYRTIKNELYSDVTIPSLFLDMYIPIASGDQLKVFLLGYREAYFYRGRAKEDLNNETIATTLSISEEEVMDAWRFWEDMGVVKIHTGPNDTISIEFLDIKYDHIKKHLDQPLGEDQEYDVDKASSSDYISMYEDMEAIAGRPLTPNEKLEIMEAIEYYQLNTDLAIIAFVRASENKGRIKSISYVKGIMKSWFDNNISSLHDLDLYEEESRTKNEIYREVFRSLGINRKNPTSYEEEVMEDWIEKYQMDKDMILMACSKTINTSTPSIKYIDGIIKAWHKSGVKTLEDVEAEDKRFIKAKEDKKKHSQAKSPRQAVPVKKTAFHNYKQGAASKYSPEELTQLVRKLNKK